MLAVWAAVRRIRARQVSRAWLRDVDRRESRVPFEGVAWRWPVNKVLNEQSRFQTARLRAEVVRASHDGRLVGERREIA